LTTIKLACALGLLAASASAADRFPATGGDLEVTPIVHASVQLEHAGRVIDVDPWRQGDYARAKPADLILVTDVQNDHLDPTAIAAIRKAGTTVLIPAAAKDMLPDGVVIANGEKKNVNGIDVEAVASYDLIPGEPFHPKGRANGYILTLGNRRVYVAGVSECTPEMKALKNIDVAFISIYLPNGRMTVPAAAECMKSFMPKVVYPYHFRTGDAQAFKDALKGQPIDVRLGEWYPNGKGLGR
jgi:L-ascorbate metabolism protein UlaG (beta-lactamase superfamily)